MAVLGLHGCMGFPCYVLSSCSHVWLFVTPCTIAHQLPLSMGFSRQEYWSGLPFPSPGNLPDPGIEPTSLMSPALSGEFFFTTEPTEEPWLSLVAVNGGYSLGRYTSFSLWWVGLLRVQALGCEGFSSCSVWAQQLWHMGLVASRQVESSWIRGWMHFCIGRCSLHHWATREAWRIFFFFFFWCGPCAQ